MIETIRGAKWLGILCLSIFLSAKQAQPQVAEGCTLKNQIYTCDRSQFQSTLTNAKTVQIEAGPRDKVTAGKLRELTVSLGKAVTAAGEPADLVFSLIHLESDGVLIGPVGTELAVLRVYGPAVSGSRGNLLWAETYFGQPDMTWPAVVQSVIQQFRSGFKK